MTPPPAATSPVASFSANTATFGPQLVGTTSPIQSITLTNTGTAPLFINGIQQSGVNAGDFGGVNAPCLGLFVAPGATCVLSFQFTPTATGPRTGQFIIIDTAANRKDIIIRCDVFAGERRAHDHAHGLVRSLHIRKVDGGLRRPAQR